MSDDAVYSKLAEQFPTEAHKRVNKGGRDQTYVPWTDKVERFNKVLGQNWSFRVVREGMTNTEAWVLGELSVTIDGVTTVRQQYGCESITKGRNETPVTDLFKIAGTDALSKAASLFGCGLYLSIAEERAEVEAAMREANRPAPKGTAATPAAGAGTQASRPANTPTTSPAAPTSSSTTATSAQVRDAAVLTGANPPTPIDPNRRKLVEAYETGLSYARSIGMEPHDPGAETLSDHDLEECVEALRSQCRYVLAERKKQAS